MLRCFGASIGKKVHIHPTVSIAIPWNLRIEDFAAIGDKVLLYNLGGIEIGHAATISQNAHLCGGTHDPEAATMDLQKVPIRVLKNAWICADAFIGPGVTISEAAIVGARAVVTKDVPPCWVVGGNPAKKLRERALAS